MVVTAASAVALAAGWFARPAAWIACAGLFYSGWVTTLTGKVNHSHHVMWVLAILAVSPAANSWAFRKEAREGSYRWPIFATMAIIGLIYFGAGVQKIALSGFAWGWSDNLLNTMLTMGWQKNQTVHQWMIDWPLGGRLLGTAGLIFELTFLPLILVPRTRTWVWPAGLVFHWCTWLILGIPFLSLQLLYVVFIPWDHDCRIQQPIAIQRRLITLLLGSIAAFSALGVDVAWPVAAYPGFEGTISPFTVDVQLLEDGEGHYLTDSHAAMAVGPERLLSIIEAAPSSGREEALAHWLGADGLILVSIDTRSGLEADRTLIRLREHSPTADSE